MSRQQTDKLLRDLDQDTVRWIDTVQTAIVGTRVLSEQGDAMLTAAGANLAVASAIRAHQAYTADGLARVEAAVRAVARRPDPKPDHQLKVSLDRIAQALEQPARQDPRARIRAARRTNRRSTR